MIAWPWLSAAFVSGVLVSWGLVWLLSLDVIDKIFES